MYNKKLYNSGEEKPFQERALNLKRARMKPFKSLS